MVDVDEQLPLGDAVADRAEPLEAGAVGGDDAVELLAGLGLLNSRRRDRGSRYFCGHGVLFQQTTFLPSARRASVRPSCEPTQSPSGRMWPTMQMVLRFADGFEDAVDDLGMGFHQQ